MSDAPEPAEMPEPAATHEQWGMRWEAVSDTPRDDSHRGRVRALVAACVVGGFVIVALGVLGVRLLLDDLDRRAQHSTPDTIHDRYQRQYASCVSSGTSRATCADRAARDCIADPRWRAGSDADIARSCVISTRSR